MNELSAERRELLIDFIDKSIDDAYNLCHGFGRIRWSPSKTREGVSICRAHGEGEGRLDAAVRGKCNVNATFQEMMDCMITETTEDFVVHESAINPSEFLDGQVLYTLVPRTPEDRFVCVKWHCIKSLAPSVAKHRDYVYVEVVDQFEDRDGKKIGYRLSKSVELEELFGADTSHMYVRGKTLTLHTFSALPSGSLELYTMMINDLGERLPTWLVHKVVETAALRCACLRDFINQKRMDMMILAKPNEMVPLSKRVCCVICTKSFSLVRKKYNCVACGEVICNQCSVHQLVASQGISEILGKKKARICVKCGSDAKTRELPRRTSIRNSDLQHDGRRSSSSSQLVLNARYSSDKNSDGENRRSFRSTGTTETSSIGSTNSTEESSARVHPTSRSSIPHMFQFRPNSTVGRKSSSTTDDNPLDSPDFDVPNLIDSSVLAIHAENETSGESTQVDVDRYNALYAKIQSEMIAAAQVSENDSPVKSKTSPVAPPTPSEQSLDEAAELIIQEVVPSNRDSLSGVARQSITAEEPEVTIVKPVVVRKITRRSSTARRKSKERVSTEQEPTPELPPNSAPMEEQLENDDASANGIQLADLKMHLDRMTQISESLRSLNILEKHPISPPSTPTDPPTSGSNVSNDERLLERQTEASHDNESSDTEVMDMRLTMDDSNFTPFLTDSSFVDMGEVAEDAPAGWKAVHSKTTGKIYYYNERRGTTSWTLPAPEAPKRSAYMVL